MKQSIAIFLILCSFNLLGQPPEFRWVKKLPLGEIISQCIDNDENIYVAGTFVGTLVLDGDTVVSQGGANTILIKFDSAGTLLWHRHFGGPGMADDIKLDNNNNLILLSWYNYSTVHYGDTFTASGHGAILTKLTSDGDLVWYKAPATNDNGCIHLNSLAVDNNNNILVRGNIQYGSGIFHDTVIPSIGTITGFLAGYNQNGDFQWVWKIHKPYYGLCIFDHANNLLVTKDTVRKYSPDKTLIWEKHSMMDLGILAVDLANNFYITNGGLNTWFIGDDTVKLDDSEIFVFIKLSPEGKPLLTKSAIANTSGRIISIGVFEDKIGVTGQFRNMIVFDGDSLEAMAAQRTNAFVVLYDLMGNMLFTKMIGSKSNCNSELISVGKSIYISGNTWDTAHFDHIAFPGGTFLARLQYQYPKPEETPDKQTFRLYPNPAHDNLTIEYPREFSNVTIDIYDIQGRLAGSFSPEDHTTALYVGGLRQGLYLVRLLSDERVFTKKFVKR